MTEIHKNYPNLKYSFNIKLQRKHVRHWLLIENRNLLKCLLEIQTLWQLAPVFLSFIEFIKTYIFFIIIIPVCLDAAGPVEFHCAESETVTDEVRNSQIIYRERETTDVWYWNLSEMCFWLLTIRNNLTILATA